MKRFRKKVLLWIFFSVVVSFASASENSNVMKISDSYKKPNPRSLLKYNSEQALKNQTDEDYIAYDLQILVEAVAKLNFSKCGQDAVITLDAMTRRERWAIQMFDSSSKFPVGLLHGNFYQMGNFDECVNLKQPFSNTDEEVPIQGQYCLADVELFNKNQYDGRVARSFENVKEKPRDIFNNTMFWSICVPASCTIDEVKIVIKEIFTLATKQKSVNVRLSEDKCHVMKSQPFSTMEIVYGYSPPTKQFTSASPERFHHNITTSYSSVIGAFGVFVLLVTAFHYYVLQQKKNFDPNNEPVRNKSFVKEVLFCFSLIKSVGKFLTTKSSELNLECICGIRFISMIFIISGHSFLFMVGGPVQNTDFYERESRNPANAIFVNSPLLVDTFLLISGFLLCYLLLVELEKRKGRINVLILYIARYIRLTPSYLVVLGFYCTFLFRIGDGPLWDSRIKLEQQRCQKSWWTNILYVNNYIHTDSLCMFQSWYLAADYHLFIIAPLVIYPLWNYTKLGKGILGIGILVSVVTPFIITLTQKLDPTLMIFAPEVYDITQNSYFKTAYIKTHMRAGSYFFGLLFGYILYKLQTKGTKMSKFVIWFGWMLSSTCGIIAMYSIVIFYDPLHEYSAFESAVYASLHRVAWCISIGWIMIACITKNASLVNRFLSWKPFIPLSRLTYCAYLMNGFIEVYSFASVRHGTYMSKLEMGSVSLSHIILTLTLAFFMCIFFESPIHGLEKILLKKSGEVKKKQIISNGETGSNTTV